MTTDILPANKRITKLQTIALDANDLPYGYDDAKWAAAKALADFINELPDGFYHADSADLELCAERMLRAYRASLARSLQRLWDQR